LRGNDIIVWLAQWCQFQFSKANNLIRLKIHAIFRFQDIIEAWRGAEAARDTEPRVSDDGHQGKRIPGGSDKGGFEFSAADPAGGGGESDGGVDRVDGAGGLGLPRGGEPGGGGGIVEGRGLRGFAADGPGDVVGGARVGGGYGAFDPEHGGGGDLRDRSGGGDPVGEFQDEAVFGGYPAGGGGTEPAKFRLFRSAAGPGRGGGTVSPAEVFLHGRGGAPVFRDGGQSDAGGGGTDHAGGDGGVGRDVEP